MGHGRWAMGDGSWAMAVTRLWAEVCHSREYHSGSSGIPKEFQEFRNS